MKDNRFTPATTSSRNLKFSIPLYQRLFAWKEENVSKLLYDLKEHFEKVPDEPYYLGMLTCKEKELIDGQQRMTVMTLMGIILKKYDSRWDEFLLNGERIIFTARSDDQEFIKNKIGIDNSGGSEYINKDMQIALETIEGFMNKNFKDDTERANFSKNVYEHLTFFIAELPDNYAHDESLLNKYFEAMNSAGRNLEQYEILKVELLKDMENQETLTQTLTQIWNIATNFDKPIIKESFENSIKKMS